MRDKAMTNLLLSAQKAQIYAEPRIRRNVPTAQTLTSGLHSPDTTKYHEEQHAPPITVSEHMPPVSTVILLSTHRVHFPKSE